MIKNIEFWHQIGASAEWNDTNAPFSDNIIVPGENGVSMNE